MFERMEVQTRAQNSDRHARSGGTYIWRRAIRHLEKRAVVILVLVQIHSSLRYHRFRASEIDAEVISYSRRAWRCRPPS